MLEVYRPKALLDDFPLKPHELLKDRSSRVFESLQAMVADPRKSVTGTSREQAMERANKRRQSRVWLIYPDEAIRTPRLQELVDEGKESVFGCTILLPPSIGGLNEQGMLDASSSTADDVSTQWYDSKDKRRRLRVRVWEGNGESEAVGDMRLIRRIEFPSPNDDGEDGRNWLWFEQPQEGGSTGRRAVYWQEHVDDVVNNMAAILGKLNQPADIDAALRCAAKYHDHGKRRRLFQNILGNFDYPNCILAKSGKKGGRRLEERYRHEFGSIVDVLAHCPDFANFNENTKDLTLHLIASHHGRARPHFPSNEDFDEAFDPEAKGDVARIAAEVPRRFARLQRKFGRWGLAYLESLLRAADWYASANPTKEVIP